MPFLFSGQFKGMDPGFRRDDDSMIRHPVEKRDPCLSSFPADLKAWITGLIGL